MDFEAIQTEEDTSEHDLGFEDAGDDDGAAAVASELGVEDALLGGGVGTPLGSLGHAAEYAEDPYAMTAPQVQVTSAYSTDPTTVPPGHSAFDTGFTNTMMTVNSEPVQEEWMKSAIRPENQEKWQQKTVHTLNSARALTRAAIKHMMANEQVHHGSARKQNTTTAGVQSTIRKKIGATEDLIKALEDRIESVEDTIRQVGECLFSLQRAHRSKWAPLNVCERRLEMREQRPLQELVRDHCQEALEHERQTLIEARQELADQIESAKEMLLNLDSTKTALLEDLQHKRHGLRIDRSCLGPAKRKAIGPQTRVVLPQLSEVLHYGSPPSPKQAQKETGEVHEKNRQVDARQLITSAVRLEEDAMRLCNAADAAMIHTKKECTRAATASQNALARRFDETDELKRKLEEQMNEIDGTITQTQMSRDRLKRELDSHDVPLRTLDKQFAMRQKRTSREGIRDNVHEELETHLESVKRNVAALANKWQVTNDMLNQLKSTREKMQEDHKCKVAALRIDDACMKVTARKAIELDRMDPRGGRCLKPASRARSHVNSSGLPRSDGFGASAGFPEGSVGAVF